MSGRQKKSLTINDIAQKAGVSKATVSRVLNNPEKVAPRTRERVLSVIRATNYRPNPMARALNIRKTGIIGVVVSDITNPFYAVMVKSIEEVCRAHQYYIFLCSTDGRKEEEEFYVCSLIDKKVDGIILAATQMDSDNIHLLQELKEADIPFVFVSRLPQERELYDYVMVDNVQGGYVATKYLISLGHEKIAYLGGRWGTSSNLDRFEGYKKALMESGFPVHEEYLFCGEFRMEGGYQEGIKMLSLRENRPTAVFCANDNMAIGLIEACREHGVEVPQEISVIGFDDIPLSAIKSIQLTTISQSIPELGALSGKILIDKILDPQKKGLRQQIVFPPKLVIRKTCAPPQNRKE